MPYSRRKFLSTTAMTIAAAERATTASAEAARPPDPIRRFRVEVPGSALTRLRRRISATQWPEKETVADQSQGVPLAMMRKLGRYWASDYDWRRCAATLNALPQFMTKIDGLPRRVQVTALKGRPGLQAP